MQIINWVRDTPIWRKGEIIDDQIYYLEARWNPRGEFWALGMYDKDENEVFKNRRIVIRTDILETISSQNKPQGILFVDSADNIEEITFDNMGGDVNLIYMTQDEILPATN